MAYSLNDVLKKSREQKERAERPKADWFGLGTGKKNPVKVRFLQELTEESPNYNSALGTALFLTEHTSPYNFKKRAECSMDTEGRCFACEMSKVELELVDEKGEVKKRPWAQKSNMYIYVVTEDKEVQVLSRPAPGTFFDVLYSFHSGDGEESITQQEFEISKGSASNDKWNLIPKLKHSFEIPDVSEVPQLDKVVGVRISYEEQKNFYIPADKVKDERPNDSGSERNERLSSGTDW